MNAVCPFFLASFPRVFGATSTAVGLSVPAPHLTALTLVCLSDYCLTEYAAAAVAVAAPASIIVGVRHNTIPVYDTTTKATDTNNSSNLVIRSYP